MRVHLIDGTYELFRYFYALPRHDDRGREESRRRAAWSRRMLALLRDGVTHVGGRVRPGHRVVPQRPLRRLQDRRRHRPDAAASQFPLAEEALAAIGLEVWAMVEFEADDALAARRAPGRRRPARVRRCVICTPDKDLAQCVRGERVVQLDRRRSIARATRRRARQVRRRARVDPRLAGAGRRQRRRHPGPAGLGRASRRRPCSRATGTSRQIPDDAARWDVAVRGADRLADLAARRPRATRCSTAGWPRCATMRRSAPRSTSSSGAARAPTSRAWPSGSRRATYRVSCAPLRRPSTRPRAPARAPGSPRPVARTQRPALPLSRRSSAGRRRGSVRGNP